MHVLILGGTRFIGPAVVGWLRDAGHDVTLFHRGETPLRREGVGHLHGSRAELGRHATAFRDLRPDVAIDLTARTERDAIEAVEVLACCVKHAVVISSIDVYAAYEGLIGAVAEEPLQGVLVESSPLRSTRYPRRSSASKPGDGQHDYDKILVERAYGEAPFATTTLRLPFVYGPRDYRDRVGFYLRLMDGGASTIDIPEGLAAWRSTRLFVSDAADAIGRAAVRETKTSELYNVGEPDAISELAWARAIGEAAAWRGRIRARGRVPERYDWRHHLVVDPSAIGRDLGVTCVPRVRALTESVRWERTRGD